jgi:hypothetical protein
MVKVEGYCGVVVVSLFTMSLVVTYVGVGS